MTRLTKYWTETSAQAFGATGAKGDLGEKFLAEVFDQWGWEHELFPGSYRHQVAGIDIAFRKPSWAKFYTADVKHNMKSDGSFYIETDPTGWLFNPKKTSDRIWHVNATTGQMAWYGRDNMRRFLVSRRLTNNGILKINRAMKLPIITYMQVDPLPVKPKCSIIASH